MATAPKTVVGYGQVEDQALAARCVWEVAADHNVAAVGLRLPLRRAACGPCVRAEIGPNTPTSQSCALVAPEWAVQVLVWSP